MAADTAEAKVDLVANGFTLDGAVDSAFGTNGLTRIDVAGEDDRGRNLVALPDGRTILVGSAKNGSNIDGIVVRLTAGGALDPSSRASYRACSRFGRTDAALRGDRGGARAAAAG